MHNIVYYVKKRIILMEDRNDESLRVMNAAKRFAEEILFPLMEQYQAYQCQSDFGSAKLSDSVILTEEVRDIERYNGLKAMCDVCLTLTLAIKSTVYLKHNSQEIEQNLPQVLIDDLENGDYGRDYLIRLNDRLFKLKEK